MSQAFCTECGYKMVFEYSKPKFCSNCGTSTSVVGASSIKQPVKQRQVSVDDDDYDEDGTDIDEVPVIDKLQFEIEKSVSSSVSSLGSFFGEHTEQSRRSRRSQNKNIGDFIDERKSTK